MKFDAILAVDAQHLSDLPHIAQSAEAIGFAGLWTPETQHNGFLPLILASEHTARIELGTAVAIAFARSPMVTAQMAWDLQALSQGRFVLGLGTQVRSHIERRFGMPWGGQPVARLREYIEAVRAIWHAWQTRERLNFRGQFYNHTLMTPFFDPGPIEHPHIPIYIAGVNEGLARLAGEACDGFHVHPFHSVKYVNEVIKPQVADGAQRTGRTLSDVVLVSSVFIVTGPDQATMTKMREAAREQIAFYASTPTYRVVLACHGWESVGEQLSKLASMKRWNEMGALITDDMLDVLTVQAPLDQIGMALRTRYEGVLDRIAYYLPYTPGEMDDVWRSTVTAVQGS
ncbi:MAG: TIGR03617 family F420-dependent LLM class oxidoreductase [Chloroflexota bacterium]